MSDAKFSIEGDLDDHGYDANLGQVLTLQPKASPGTDIRTYTFTVVVKLNGTPEIPELPTGTPVALTPTPTSPLDITFPASGTTLSYLIRGQINGGVRTIAGPNGQPQDEVVPAWTWERIVLLRTGSGQRPMLPTERFQYDEHDGWCSAINDMVNTWGAGAVVGPVSSTLDAVSTWGNLLGGTLLDNPLVRISAGKLLLGSNPPTLGALNFSSAQAIYWETTPSGNMRALTVDASNNLILGSNDPDFSGDLFLQTDVGKVEVQIDGTPDFKVEQTLTTSFNPVAIGATPAGAGDIQLSKSAVIAGNNDAGTGNIPMLSTFFAASDFLVVGGDDADLDGGVITAVPTGAIVSATIASVSKLTVHGTKVSIADDLELGATPAGSGSLRLSKAFTARANNNAGADYIPAIATDGADRLLIGGNYTGNAGMSLDVKAGHTILANVAGTTELTVAGSKVTVTNELEVDGTLNHDGTDAGFRGVAPVALSAAYTVTNASTDRTYNANQTTIHELADVLATLIGDLQAQGLLGS